MVAATCLTTALIVGAVGAWHLIRDLHGINTLEHQPRKVAAMEGHWETQRGAPRVLFGWPDAAREETRFALEIP